MNIPLEAFKSQIRLDAIDCVRLDIERLPKPLVRNTPSALNAVCLRPDNRRWSGRGTPRKKEEHGEHNFLR
jgi:hypothetical protein